MVTALPTEKVELEKASVNECSVQEIVTTLVIIYSVGIKGIERCRWLQNLQEWLGQWKSEGLFLKLRFRAEIQRS